MAGYRLEVAWGSDLEIKDFQSLGDLCHVTNPRYPSLVGSEMFRAEAISKGLVGAQYFDIPQLKNGI